MDRRDARRGPGEQRADRRRHGLGGRHPRAVRARDRERARRQRGGEAADVRGHAGRDVRVEERRLAALDLARVGAHAVADGHGHAERRERPRHGVLGRAVGGRVQQHDRDGADAPRAQGGDRAGEVRGGRALGRAAGRVATGPDADDVAGREERRDARRGQVEEARAVAAPDGERVLEPRRRDEADAGPAPCQHGVRGDGGPVVDAVARPKAPTRRMASRTARPGSSGVLRTLAVRRPRGPSATRSVNVPPVSTPRTAIPPWYAIRPPRGTPRPRARRDTPAVRGV